jgi:hypothetical protein
LRKKKQWKLLAKHFAELDMIISRLETVPTVSISDKSSPLLFPQLVKSLLLEQQGAETSCTAPLFKLDIKEEEPANNER